MDNKTIFCDKCKYWNKNFHGSSIEPGMTHLCDYYSIPEDGIIFISPYDDFCENGEEREENK